MKRNVWIAGVVLTALLGGPVQAEAQSTAEVALRQAMETETIKGDLKSAIEQYRKIAAGTDRAVAAKALIRMADCHQKLGSADAQQVYQRILRDFADQNDAVVEAKLRLAALGGASSGTAGVRTRLLWDNAIDLWGSASADGRLLSFVDWGTGDLAVRDLVAGQNRRVTNKGGYIKAEAEAEANAISPDGRLIAFGWNRWDKQAGAEGSYQLRIIGIDGSNERVLLTGKDIDYAEPQAWSPDGGLIAVHVLRGPRPQQRAEIALVSPNGSQMRTLLTMTDRIPFSLRFSPDGRWLAFDLLDRQAGAPRASRIAIMPSDGSASSPADLIPNANVMGWTPDGRGVLFRREREGDTELFVQPIANGRATGDARRISSVSDVGASLGITPQGALIFGRSRRTIDAALTSFDATTGRIGALTVERPLAEFGLGGTGGGVKFSPDGSKAFFVTVRTTVVLRNMSDGSERSIVPQMNRLRRLEWSADSQALLASGLSGDKEGIHRIDLATGAATLLFESGPVPMFAAIGGWPHGLLSHCPRPPARTRSQHRCGAKVVRDRGRAVGRRAVKGWLEGGPHHGQSSADCGHAHGHIQRQMGSCRRRYGFRPRRCMVAKRSTLRDDRGHWVRRAPLRALDVRRREWPPVTPTTPGTIPHGIDERRWSATGAGPLGESPAGVDARELPAARQVASCSAGALTDENDSESACRPIAWVRER